MDLLVGQAILPAAAFQAAFSNHSRVFASGEGQLKAGCSTLVLALLLALLVSTPALAAETATQPVREILLVHFTHTDLGFTDHPVVAEELQRRYLDIAVDASLATRGNPPSSRFHWTVEASSTFYEWWKTAPLQRREKFLDCVRAGQIDVTAMPFNTTPFLNALQWDVVTHWLPEPLWTMVHPRIAMQDDVNGFPRAGARLLLQRGIHSLWTGINSDSGGPPMPAPSAFWWKMPDGQRLFVWVGLHYGSGYDFFEAQSWRLGPVPRAADTAYRPPRPGEIFASDEESVRRAQQRCITQIHALGGRGYSYPIVILPVTNQWRLDNDPPFPPLADFVAEWNKLGLEPALRLTTVSDALQRVQREIGGKIPEYAGEWTDWWANGTASAPRELAASREAKRNLAAAVSPVWGAVDRQVRSTIEKLYRSLCLFDEHTWGSSMSAALPDSLDSAGQFNEKAGLAWRAMAESEFLLSQRARTRIATQPEGLYVVNTAGAPLSGWVRFAAGGLRGDFASVEDASSGDRQPIRFEEGMSPWTRPQSPRDLAAWNTEAVFADRVPRRVAAIWVQGLAANTTRRYRLLTAAAAPPASAGSPDIRLDSDGWPVSAKWSGMADSLFLIGFGNFLSERVRGFAPRWKAMDIFKAGAAERSSLRSETLEEQEAKAGGMARFEDTGPTLVYEQPISHSRLLWAIRRLEIWKSEPRVSYTLRLDRISSDEPEAFFVDFPLPSGETLPRLSSGGDEFVPYRDQLPGTCRDYFAFDGWAQYDTPVGHWLWFSRDAALVTFGGNQLLAKRSTAPDNPGHVMAMVFNNFWYTNFPGNSHGAMQFRFDVVWKAPGDSASAAGMAAAVTTEPVVEINPGGKEEPLYLRWLYKP
jgi:hypothetical protein